MTGQGRGAFTPVLRQVGDSLTVPLPRRTRFLRELADDLDALTDRLEADGLARGEARRRATQFLVPDPETLQALERLHSPWYVRVTHGMTPATLQRAERLGLSLATLSVLAPGSALLIRADVLSDPSPFLWPVLAIGVALCAALVAKGFQLWIKHDHADPARGLRGILWLSGLTVVTATFGVLRDLYHLAATLEATPEASEVLATAWLQRDATLLAVAILIGLGGALGWFVLSQWVAFTRGAQVEVLGRTERCGSRPTFHHDVNSEKRNEP